jgi:hypothetical protein
VGKPCRKDMNAYWKNEEVKRMEDIGGDGRSTLKSM